MFRSALSAALIAAASISAQLPVATPETGVGVVLTLSNDATDNQVMVALRAFGDLVPFASYSTGGTGTASGLGSQSALDADQRHLVAVNPGSNDVTLFRRDGIGLERLDVAATGGMRPTSVDMHGDLVYALNADSDDVTGFRIVGGSLDMIGRYPLSGSGVAAAQVGFSPRGDHLVVTERATDRILVYPVQADGSLGMPSINAANAPTPFGFAFRRDGTLIVSEAVMGMPGLGVVSSYRIVNGALQTVSAAVPTNQTAACWIAIPRDGRFAYTTNTGTGNVTGYDVDRKGALTRLDASGATGTLSAGAAPIDCDFNAGGRLLFVLDAANDRIEVFERAPNGGLTLLSGSWSLPDGAAGVIAR